MVVHRLKSKSAQLDEWRVAKKIKPSQRGAIKLARSYGSELLCVRYRENPEGTERLTTVELVVERVVIQKRDDPIVSFKIRHDELTCAAWPCPRAQSTTPKTSCGSCNGAKCSAWASRAESRSRSMSSTRNMFIHDRICSYRRQHHLAA